MALYVIDTSALVSLGLSEVFTEITGRLDLHITSIVVEELEEMAERQDDFADSPTTALKEIDEVQNIQLHELTSTEKRLHRALDPGESSCIDLVNELNGDYLVTDDHRASSALEDYLGPKIVFSPILLKALTTKNIITERKAVEELHTIAQGRNWFDSPLYTYALELFGEEPLYGREFQ